MEGTSLAILQFTKDSQSFCVLYYIKDTGGAVVRATLNMSAAKREWAYSEISEVGRAPAPGTSLCAVWSEADQKVILTYATGTSKTSKLASFWDKADWS